MVHTTSAGSTRMSAQDRRDHVLDAATRCFSRTGFAGTSTDAIAREAGVSQPYVVRIFGTKQTLFLEAFARSAERIRDAFAGVLAAEPFDPDDEDDVRRLGSAYTDLLADRELMLVVLHGFAAGDNEEIGERARSIMGGIYRMLVDNGMAADQARDFIAKGMLLTVLMAMRAPEHFSDSGDLAGLVECAFGEAMPLVGGQSGADGG